MKRITLIILATLLSFVCRSQILIKQTEDNGIILDSSYFDSPTELKGANIPLDSNRFFILPPVKYDTVKCIFLVSQEPNKFIDENKQVTKYPVLLILGYTVLSRSGYDFDLKYLDHTKRDLHKSLVVWQAQRRDW